MTRLDNKSNPIPGIGGAVIFRSKALAFQARRARLDFESSGVKRYAVDNVLTEKRILAESRSPLWTAHEDEERVLLAGKIHNLRLAIRRLNGVEVPVHAVFSFWKHIKRTSRLKGYVAGRELREGCLIPGIGGGLCQLSNALYDTALRAGFEIVERHAHTEIIPGSLAETERDATVFWNYVDLRFKSRRAFRIEAELTVDSLVVRFRGEPLSKGILFVLPGKPRSTNANQIKNCFSCGIDDCFRQVRKSTGSNGFGRTAYLVDEYWPEFDRYIGATKRETDLLCIPLDGKRLRRPNYAWTTTGFGTIKQSRLFTLWRSYQSRKLASQGAVRQRALLAAHERLARRYGSQLSYDITHLILTSNLLPFLWRNGELGGRTFDVLMTNFPLAVLHERLDAAIPLHPESRTLSDFRAEHWLVHAETEGLRQARKIITPHTEIAELYPDKSVLIDWAIPGLESRNGANRKPRIIFPAATVARKGAYKLRDALTGLDVQLAIMGPILEGDGFWDGLRVERLAAGDDWLAGAAAVVLPAFMEHRPRPLLEAVARGVPVIASPGCGLENVSGVTTIRAGDVTSLRAELEKVISKPFSGSTNTEPGAVATGFNLP
jgi:hypothetical protein